MAPVLAIFPLDVVLLPGQAQPMHIFEPRYRQLIADVRLSTDHPSFGIVASRSVEVGTLAEIIEYAPYEDGRADLLTLGSRRFRVLAYDDQSRPYLQATVQWLPEEDGEITEDLLGAVRVLGARYRRHLGVLAGRELSGEVFAADPLRLSYQIAAQLWLPNSERQDLLEASTAARRLRRALGLLRREILLMAATHSVPMTPGTLRQERGAN